MECSRKQAINAVALALAVILLLVSQVATAADRVNTMMTYRSGAIQPWQVRPGVPLAVFGNATDIGFMPGDGSANGDTYTFSFSVNPNVLVTDDGSLSGTVAGDKFISENVTFTLMGGSTREVIEVTLTVDDGAGSVDSDTREIDIVDPTDPISDTALENLAIEVNISIQDGLRAAYLSQAADGSWLHGTSGDPVWHCGTTGFTVWAFANSGHLPTNDVDTDIYAEFVQKGVDYILSQANSATPPAVQTYIGDPDGDGNGRMIALCGPSGVFYGGYASPIAAAGIIAAYSAAPGTLVPGGAFAGEAYSQIIQDAIDWTAFGQVEVAGGRGGWRYYANYPGSDTSIDSWHYVANEGFEAVFGGSVLELVKQEAEIRIDASQSQGVPGDLGQFGYGGTGPLGFDGNATTAGGLSGLAMVTAGGRVPPLLDGGTESSATFPDSATRIAAAVAHLGLRWDAAPGIWAGNRGNFYAMWTTARALRLNAVGLLVDKNVVTFDWQTGEDQALPGLLPPDNDVHEGYFPFLVRTQAASGHWGPTVNTGNWTQNLNTAWGILILQPTVFGPPVDDDEFTKELTSGPDNDLDGDIDLVVEVNTFLPVTYDFTITYTLPDNPVLIEDTVPAEWDVTIPGETNDLGCGWEPANKGRKPGKSASKISCPDPSIGDPIEGSTVVFADARCHNNRRNQRCRPTSCGALYLNDGAEAYAVDEFGDPLVDEFGDRLPPIAVTDGICLAAVYDLNGGGLVWDGTGDEDGDGFSDYEEACGACQTDPCVYTPDADGDLVPDSCDNCVDTENPGQEDGDGDGIGDVCDPCPEDPDTECVCATGFTCGGPLLTCTAGVDDCRCGTPAEGGAECVGDWFTFCSDLATCGSSADCPADRTCVVDTCCGVGVCMANFCTDLPVFPESSELTPGGQ